VVIYLPIDIQVRSQPAAVNIYLLIDLVRVATNCDAVMRPSVTITLSKFVHLGDRGCRHWRGTARIEWARWPLCVRLPPEATKGESSSPALFFRATLRVSLCVRAVAWGLRLRGGRARAGGTIPARWTRGILPWRPPPGVTNMHEGDFGSKLAVQWAAVW